MRHVIVGTAGHIDHGKTALVRALTGIDTDRLEEEKRRGISIDLGFAHLDLNPGLRLGFVDVPGHERFIRNMLAGASGIDLVVLVIAADESIKPQTREHFEICRLLGVRGGVVALTKSDLADADMLELARLEIEQFVSGSFLESAPMVAVSATTKAGLDDLRAALERAAASVPGKDSSRHPRLPIDRSFSMRGHGAVVTGTLTSGSIAIEDELELYPTGRRLRVRGLQVHGAPVQRAYAGQRTAANLSGIDSAEISRGMTLASPRIFRAVTQVDCAFRLVPGAAQLKHGAPVHFHAGTAEVEAEARLIGSYVRFLLREPVLMLPGDRFIVRKFSPVTTIGGGVVIDTEAPPRCDRKALAVRLGKLEQGSPAARVALLVDESEHGMARGDLMARTGLLAAEIEEIVASGSFVRAGDWIAPGAWAAKKIVALRQELGKYHAANPLVPGYPKQELRSRELPGAPPHLLDALVARAGDIVLEADAVRLSSHRVTPQGDEADAVEHVFAAAGLEAPPLAEALALSGIEPSRARALLRILLTSRKLVRVSETLVCHAAAIDAVRARLASRKGARFSVAEFKDWTGVSRKYAIPLLEFFDRERVTRREGDQRVIL